MSRAADTNSSHFCNHVSSSPCPEQLFFQPYRRGPPSPVPEGDENEVSQSSEDIECNERAGSDHSEDVCYMVPETEAYLATTAAANGYGSRPALVRACEASIGKENVARQQCLSPKSHVLNSLDTSKDCAHDSIYASSLRSIGVQAGNMCSPNSALDKGQTGEGLAALAATALQANAIVGSIDSANASLLSQTGSVGCAKLSRSDSGVSLTLPGKGTAVFRSRTPRLICKDSKDRKPLSEVNPSARCHELYLDVFRRRERQEAMQKEKNKEQELSSSQPPPLRRPWHSSWATEQRQIHEAKLRLREEQRCMRAEQREQQALQECSFTPRLVAQSRDQLRLAKAERQVAGLAQRQQALLHRFKALQSDRKVSACARRESAKPVGAGPLPCMETSPAEEDRLRQCPLPHRLPETYPTRNSIIQELKRVHDEAFGIMSFLASKGISSVMDDPDPATLCEDFDTGLVRRLALEEAWACRDETNRERCRSSSGPLPH